MLRIIKKFGILLNKQQKKKVYVIVFLMLIGAILETLSVSMIAPLLTALMQKDAFDPGTTIGDICSMLGITSPNTFILLVIGVLIVLYIAKDAFLYFEYYVQTRFICNTRVTIQYRLMDVYLHRPYEFFLNINSGEIMRVIRGDTSSTFSLLTVIMSFFTEAVVAAALIITIIVIDPVMAGMVAVLLLAVMLIIYKIIKPVLRVAGVEFQRNNSKANQWLLQSVAGVKEMKVANKEEFFIDEYTKYAENAVMEEKKSIVLGNAPRLVIEAVVVCGMLGYMGFMIVNGSDITDMLPQISAFAFAAVRLLPSANRMSSAMNAVAYQEPMLDKTIENIKTADVYEKEDRLAMEEKKKQQGAKTVTLEKECALSDISFSYPNTEAQVLDCAGMRIPVGKSVGIVGTSGAGKTTAVDILLGLLKPQAGRILSDGTDIHEDYAGWLSHLSYIPQMIYMLDDTIRANVAFGFHKSEVDDERVWKALEEAQLKEFVEGLPDGINTTIGERGIRLSGGQRQRIGIARALYTDPELLIFDEATSALDNETEAAIMESVNSLHGKKTMIIIAHRLTTIKECDIIYRVENGKITETHLEE